MKWYHGTVTTSRESGPGEVTKMVLSMLRRGESLNVMRSAARGEVNRLYRPEDGWQVSFVDFYEINAETAALIAEDYK